MTDPAIFVLIAMTLGFCCGAAVVWISQPYCCRLEPEKKCECCGR